jgi:cysteine synthase A
VPVESLRDVQAVTADRHWVDWAVARLHADARRSADTHLLRLPTPASSPVDIYVKDESTHPTGSLKHRLARSLFLYAICNGDIDRGSTVVEAPAGRPRSARRTSPASSGSPSWPWSLGRRVPARSH